MEREEKPAGYHRPFAECEQVDFNVHHSSLLLTLSQNFRLFRNLKHTFYHWWVNRQTLVITAYPKNIPLQTCCSLPLSPSSKSSLYWGEPVRAEAEKRHLKSRVMKLEFTAGSLHLYLHVLSGSPPFLRHGLSAQRLPPTSYKQDNHYYEVTARGQRLMMSATRHYTHLFTMASLKTSGASMQFGMNDFSLMCTSPF